jgi:site-specific recombinase XerD
LDTISVTKENLVTDSEGSLWLKYRRRKTELLARVKLLPEAITLIEKYKEELRDTLFPMQRYDILRANMKGLAVMADLTQNLVYHLGRQTFACLIMLEEGVPMETISLMLGHSNIKTTQVYARVTPKKFFEDMDKFIDATQDLKLII